MNTVLADSVDIEELCQLCKRPKRKHTTEELKMCYKKYHEFQKQKIGGAGIY